jgi:hypothetical protein
MQDRVDKSHHIDPSWKSDLQEPFEKHWARMIAALSMQD